VPLAPPSDAVEQIPIREMDDDELARMSVERVLFMDRAELDVVRAYYRREGRDPTDVELETLAQTWSEHCVHKTFKAVIDYRCHDRSATRLIDGRQVPEPERQQVDGLLKTYIRAPTEQLAKPWVRSAFVDNAGILALDERWDVSFKVETHNHPSALEPFGGANTGVGGVVRDVIGVSARPIANTDVLCFGPQDLPPDRLPGGALHPRRVAAGVIAGIEDYGNKMGIPTVNGAILYDPGYTGNPLVYCGCLGIAPRDSHRNRARAGDLCVAVGGRTGRDGLHGATFSSAELTHETGQTVGSVVQIGNPIAEKTFLEAILVARDEGLYTSITDCGAGGFSSAVGEMGREVGVRVDLAAAPLKYPGLRPWEVWLSEAQERMILALPQGNLDRLRQVCDARDVELTVIGRFTGDQRLTLCYGEQVVGSLEMDFLHDGIPRRRLRADWGGGLRSAADFRSADRGSASSADLGDLGEVLLRLLASPNIASKESVIRRYDHEVQGATVVKPLTGVLDDGPSDAAVLRPLELQSGGPDDHVAGPTDAASWRGLALGCGLNPGYGRLDPYAMAWAAIDEALRNVVARALCLGQGLAEQRVRRRGRRQNAHPAHAADLGPGLCARRAPGGDDGRQGRRQPALSAGRDARRAGRIGPGCAQRSARGATTGARAGLNRDDAPAASRDPRGARARLPRLLGGWAGRRRRRNGLCRRDRADPAPGGRARSRLARRACRARRGRVVQREQRALPGRGGRGARGGV
jgi:phosphoribosylformylglycinamidine synthase